MIIIIIIIVVVPYFQKQPPEVSCKKGVLKKFANFIGKHSCSYTPVRRPILKNICERMILYFHYIELIINTTIITFTKIRKCNFIV